MEGNFGGDNMPSIKLTQAEVNKAAITGKRYKLRDTEIQGLILVVSAAGGKTYAVDYYDIEGRRTEKKLGRADSLSLTQARDAAKELLAKVALGLEVKEKRPKRTKGKTLGEFLEDLYIPWVIANRKAGKQTAEMLRRSFSFLWEEKLSDITRLLVERWMAGRLEENKAASINRVAMTLKAALNWGVERDLIPSNPLMKLKKLKETDSPGRVRYLSDEERLRLTGALEQHDKKYADHLRPLIEVAMNTGIRRGSLFGLIWADVDFDLRTIRLRGEEAKSGKQNYIPMNDVVLDILTSWRDRHSEATATDLVFPSPVNGKRFDNCNSAWETLMREAKVENFHWHDMRHDFASRLVMSGVDLNTVRELLGHADLKMTLRYAHLAPAAKKKAVDQLIRGR